MVVFDLDDTLYKERDYVASGIRALAAAFPGADLSGEWTPAMLDAFRSHTPAITLDSDARQLLSWLKSEGVPMAVVTDGRSLTQRRKFAALGLDEYIDPGMMLVSEETGHDKLSGVPFRMLMEAAPGESRWIYVGDNPAKDFLQPKKLGWTTVMLNDVAALNVHPQHIPDTDHAPHLVIDSLASLPQRVRIKK